MGFLETKRLSLIPLEEEHTELIIKWRNDKDILFNFFSYMPLTRAEHLHWLNSKPHDRIDLMIQIKKTSDFIGVVNLSNIDHRNQHCEYGILIGEKSFWGKGYAREATECILDYAFDVLNMRKVYLYVQKENERAIKLYTSIGFEVEGDFREEFFKNGRFVNILKMAKFRGIKSV